MTRPRSDPARGAPEPKARSTITVRGVRSGSSPGTRHVIRLSFRAALGTFVAVIAFGALVLVPGSGASAFPGSVVEVTPTSSGYVLVSGDGGVFTFGGSVFVGSMSGTKLSAPIVGGAETPDGGGNWFVGRDAGVFATGDASFDGSGGSYNPYGPPGSCGGGVCAAALRPRATDAPAVGIAPDPAADGYVIVHADGSVYSYGNAFGFYSGLSQVKLQAPVVGIAFDPASDGVWLVAADGGVFALGDAPFLGSLGGIHLRAPIAGIAADPDGGGYWLVGADGGVFAFGDASFAGSLPRLGVAPVHRVVGIAPSADGGGYWLVGADGGVFAFGDAPFLGSMAGHRLASPVAGIAASSALPPCQPELSASTDHISYPLGVGSVSITLTYRNPSPYGCADTTAATSGCGPGATISNQSGQVVWQWRASPFNTPTSCPAALSNRAIGGGETVTSQVVWTQDYCASSNSPPGEPNPSCPETAVPAGTYTIEGEWGFGALQSPPISIVLDAPIPDVGPVSG